MKRALLVVSFLFFIVGFSRGQQDPQYTQFMFDRLSVNPGYAGMPNAICATGFYRNQWMGFPDNTTPKTFMLNAHAPIQEVIPEVQGVLASSAAGITYYNDQLGAETNNIFRLSYAYHKPIGIGTLGGGLSVGVFNKALSQEWIARDPVSEDNAIPNTEVSNTTYDVSLGFYYKTNKLYMGLSTTHLTQSGLNYEASDYDLNMKMKRHYYVMAGYDYFIGGDQTYILKPAILAKSDAASTQIDINVRLLYNQMVWGGISYRAADAVSPMIGYIDQLGKGTAKIGVAYDVTTSELNNYSNGTIEIMLNYCFSMEDPVVDQKVKSVRFL